MQVSPLSSVPLSYQWSFNSTPIQNTTNATFSIASAQTNHAGGYNVVITNLYGAATSAPLAMLTVLVPPSPPVITSQPQSQTNQAGSPVSFCVGVTGTPPFAYQWRRDGVTLGGATQSCLIFPSVRTNDAGAYSVVVNSPANQPVTSDPATLVVVNGTPVPTNGIGFYTVSNGCYIVTGSGEDIEDNEDRFFFVYRPLTGDGQVVAQLSGLTPDNPLSEAGAMLRDGFTGGDRHVFVAKNAQNEVMFRRRLVANYNSVENSLRATNTTWLRLMRTGNTFVGHSSTNGIDWELV